MKIRAIRLKEVGRFSEPVALEGLSGGLDVLSGPNELGKSTILEALKLVLFEKHTSKDRKTVGALRPYAGGAPLIEVDLETGADTWRIRKQFLDGRSVELRNLRSGEIARGADAETRLAKLLASADGSDRFALLWVDQGAALAPLNPTQKAGGALHAVIEGEVESVADGGAARFVAARLKAELSDLVTSHNPPRPTGRYKGALDEQRALASRRETARARLANVQARLDQLESVREKIAHLADPAVAAQSVQAKADAEGAFEAARGAREKLRLAEEALARHEEKVTACAAALESLRAKITDLSKLEEAAMHEAPRLVEVSKRLRQEETRTQAARKKRDETKEALTAAERGSKAQALAAQLREVTDRLNAARAAAGERKGLLEALAANGAEEGLLSAARREAQSIATLSARLTAAAPTIAITYAAGGAGKIRIGGKPLAHGDTLHPAQPVTLEIEGIGAITVAPGRSDSAADDAVDMAAHEAQLAHLLRRMGTASLADAERRAEERRALQSQLAEVSAQLRERAPDGVERLEAAHAELARRAALLGPAPKQDREAMDLRILELTEARANAEEDFDATSARRNDVGKQEVQLRTRAAERAAHIEQLAAELGDLAARKARLEKLTMAIAEATGVRNAAARDAAAWREAAPDEARFSGLKRAAEAASAAVIAADKELSELQKIEAGIEGELKGDRADDVGSAVAELDEASVAADERVRALTQELGALQLLARELDKASSETRERFAKPVFDRLEPYLRLVFPDGRLSLGEGFALETLQRGKATEKVAVLSEGTREQLAVLVRLGFGRLLAEAGSPAPLILDDALVYSDDTRIERMFEALKLAAESHQVLVLTCRERTFASLGGNRVAVTAWRPS